MTSNVVKICESTMVRKTANNYRFVLGTAMDEATSPFHLRNDDHPGIVLVSPLLTGSNYHSWSRAMITALTAKNKLGFVDGTLTQPEEDDLLLGIWKRCNRMVISWLLHAVNPEIANSLLYFDTAAEIWTDLHVRFSWGNGPRIYQLKQQFVALKQGSMDVSTYYTKSKALWDELRGYQSLPNCECGGLKIWGDSLRMDYVLQFLIGLNESYSQIRALITLVDPFPPISEVFSLVLQEERQRIINNGVSLPVNSASSTLNAMYFDNCTEKEVVEPKGSQLRENMSESLECVGEDFFIPCDKVYDSFDTMGLHQTLLTEIYAYGFVNPSAIQQRGIVPFCNGFDVIEQAQPGTGRTTTICLGILQRLRYSLTQCQALVLVPNREHARHIKREMRRLGDYLGVNVHTCGTDGTSLRKDQRILAVGVLVVVGTTKRVLDMLQRQLLSSDYIAMLVLDEADEMLSRGFNDEIYNILRLLPPKVQVGVFFTTMPPKSLEITRKLMNKPMTILLKPEELIPEGINQFYVDVKKEDDKVEIVHDICRQLCSNQHIIIFVNGKETVDWLAEEMRCRCTPYSTILAIHEDTEENTIKFVVQEFQWESPKILIATDVMPRLHFKHLSVVINYHLPTSPEDYVHRIGKTTIYRFHKRAISINLLTKDDHKMLDRIRKFYNTVIEELPANLAYCELFASSTIL